LDVGIRDPENGSSCFGGHPKMKAAKMAMAIDWMNDFIGNDPWNNLSQQFNIINVLK
jgi:hypothetical protein